MKAAVGLLLVTACASTPSPREVLDAYAAALERGDYAAAYALTDESFQAMVSSSELERFAVDHPESVRQFAEAWSAPDANEIVLISASGRWVRMVREGATWRLASGGLEPARWDDPLGALAAFFAAVRAGRLDEVRRAIPDAERARFESDDALRAHLEDLRGRIERASVAIGPLQGREVRIDSDEARLVYGEGRSVRFRREQGVWRVLDLE